jgi:hypothetical protein
MEQATVEKLVTARVVGEAMGIATSQVYRLSARGQIRSYLVGEKKAACASICARYARTYDDQRQCA